MTGETGVERRCPPRSPKGRGSEHGDLCRAELHKRDGQKEPNEAYSSHGNECRDGMTSRRLHLIKEGSELRAGTGPHGWGAENASFIGRRSEGRAEHPSP